MWFFDNIPFEQSINDIKSNNYVGFVYKITNLETNQAYFGKKQFFSKRKLKPMDTRRTTLESDWKKYYGSASSIKDDVKRLGKDRFKREILYLCKTLRAMSYYETKLQFMFDVILDDKYYNDNILGKYFSSDMNHILSAVKSASL